MPKLPVDDLTRRGIDAIRGGNTTAGRGFLQHAVEAEPGNAIAWHWLASVGLDEAEQRRCLLRVLEITPEHPFALRDLAALDQRRAKRQPAEPTTTMFTRRAVPASGTHGGSRGPATEPAPERPASTFTGAARAQAVQNVDDPSPREREGAQDADTSPLGGVTIGAVTGTGAPPPPQAPANAIADSASPPSPSITEILASIRSGTPAGASRQFPGTAVEDGEVVAGAHEKPRKEVPLGSPLTVDDAVALVDKEHHGRETAPGKPVAGTRKRNFAILSLLCLALMLGMGTRHIVQSRTNAAGGGSVAPKGALAPQPAMTTIRTAYGDFLIPGTAYLNNRVGPPTGEGSIIPIQRAPFTSSRRAACALPNGAAVLLLDMRTAEDGSRAFEVQHRECAGWVAESFLNTTPLGLPPTPVGNTTVGWNVSQ